MPITALLASTQSSVAGAPAEGANRPSALVASWQDGLLFGRWLTKLGLNIPGNAPVIDRGWGPVEKTQMDGRGQPIQMYRTALFIDVAGVWHVVQDVVDLDTGAGSRATLATVSPMSAKQWLCENSFSQDESAPRN